MTADAEHPDLGDWAEEAACRTSHPDLFFPETVRGDNHAKAICSRCPVRTECLNHALDTDEKYGVWGGLTPRERRRLQRNRR